MNSSFTSLSTVCVCAYVHCLTFGILTLLLQPFLNSELHQNVKNCWDNSKKVSWVFFPPSAPSCCCLWQSPIYIHVVSFELMSSITMSVAISFCTRAACYFGAAVGLSGYSCTQCLRSWSDMLHILCLSVWAIACTARMSTPPGLLSKSKESFCFPHFEDASNTVKPFSLGYLIFTNPRLCCLEFFQNII